MADPGQRPVSAAFAPPPPLWKHFTPENIYKLEEIKAASSKGQGKEKGKEEWTPSELRALDLPPELRFLVPPETPTSGYYSVFGELQSVSHCSSVGFLVCWILQTDHAKALHGSTVSQRAGH